MAVNDLGVNSQISSADVTCYLLAHQLIEQVIEQSLVQLEGCLWFWMGSD